MTYATQEDLNTLANLVGAAARAAESANNAAERVCDQVDGLSLKLDAYIASNDRRLTVLEGHLDSFIAESQRLFTKIGETAAQNQARCDRLDGVIAALVHNNELQQQQLELQQLQLDNQNQRLAATEETLKSVNAAVERLEAIVDRLVGNL